MWYIEIIKQVMQEKGLSQQAFADILGMPDKNKTNRGLTTYF